MGMPNSKQALDREQAYIRSQTSTYDVGYAGTGAAFDSSIPKLSDLACYQRIYEQIIRRFTGERFETAMSAAVDIDRALQQLRSMPTDVQIVEKSQGIIQKSYRVLRPMDEDIAIKVSDCVREQAQNYDAEAPIRAWLMAFPSENG